MSDSVRKCISCVSNRERAILGAPVGMLALFAGTAAAPAASAAVRKVSLAMVELVLDVVKAMVGVMPIKNYQLNGSLAW